MGQLRPLNGEFCDLRHLSCVMSETKALLTKRVIQGCERIRYTCTVGLYYKDASSGF